MTADGTAEDTLFRLWREGARAFAELGAAAVRAMEGEDPAGVTRRMETLSSAWARFLEAMAAAQEARATAPGASPFDPAGWMRGPGEGGMADLWRWLEGPEFADLFGEQRRLIRESGEWARLTAALEQYRAVMARGWVRAFQTFAERLSTAEKADDGRPAWDALVAIWREAAEEEMARVQASDAYVAASRDLLAAHLAVRASLRARAERMAEFLGLPTRAEVDDLTETVHHLRRELRRMRRDAAADDAGPSP